MQKQRMRKGRRKFSGICGAGFGGASGTDRSIGSAVTCLTAGDVGASCPILLKPDSAALITKDKEKTTHTAIILRPATKNFSMLIAVSLSDTGIQSEWFLRPTIKQEPPR
jgi:hypothetical protein